MSEVKRYTYRVRGGELDCEIEKNGDSVDFEDFWHTESERNRLEDENINHKKHISDLAEHIAIIEKELCETGGKNISLTAMNKQLLEACIIGLKLSNDYSYEEWMDAKAQIESAIEKAKNNSKVDEIDRLTAINKQLLEACEKIKITANNVLYFADNSDYETALYEILSIVVPEMVYDEPLKFIDESAIEKSQEVI